MRNSHRRKITGDFYPFAWDDSIALASLLEEQYDAKHIRDAFETISVKTLSECEYNLQDDIRELLSRSEGQRPAFLRKLAKAAPDHPEFPGLLLVLAIIAQLRVLTMLSLRDNFRLTLTPGRCNRSTCANLHTFGMELAKLHREKPQFPYEVFAAFDSPTFSDDAAFRRWKAKAEREYRRKKEESERELWAAMAAELM